MEKRVHIFSGAAEADEADAREDALMSPEERVQLVLELRNRFYPDAAKQGFARVCRITELEQG
jgi:hypothetical protein